jgi:hypothetical protein
VKASDWVNKQWTTIYEASDLIDGIIADLASAEERIAELEKELSEYTTPFDAEDRFYGMTGEEYALIWRQWEAEKKKLTEHAEKAEVQVAKLRDALEDSPRAFRIVAEECAAQENKDYWHKKAEMAEALLATKEEA